MDYQTPPVSSHQVESITSSSHGPPVDNAFASQEWSLSPAENATPREYRTTCNVDDYDAVLKVSSFISLWNCSVVASEYSWQWLFPS
jgi:hypothetical protein